MSPRPWQRNGVALAAVVFGARLVVSWSRVEYALWPDEPAQLAMARFFGGGTRWDMHDHSTWRPGYAALISPLHWFTDDPAMVMRGAHVVNAVLGAVAAVLLYLLARRITTLGPLGCALAAGAVSLSPARLFTTDFVWSESLVAVLFLAALWALLRFDEAPSPGRGVALALASAAAFAAHSRMLPLSIVAVVVLAMAVRRRRLSLATGVVSIGVNVAGLAVTAGVSRLVIDRLWRDPAATNTVGGVLHQLRRPDELLVSIAGQTWYQLVASVGIVGVGAWALVRRTVSEQADRHRTDARLIAAAVGSCLLLSMVFMAGRMRADQVVYGRYSDAVVGPLLLLGLAAIARALPLVPDPEGHGRRRGMVLVGVTAGSAVVLAVFRGEALGSSNGLEPMILGLQPFAVASDHIDVLRITAVALIVAIVLAALPWRGRAALLVTLLLVGDVRTGQVLASDWPNRGGQGGVAVLADIGAPLADGAPVDFFVREGSDSTEQLMLYQMYLPHSRFTVVAEQTTTASSRYVFASASDEVLRDSGALPVWTDRFGRFSLWDRSAVEFSGP